jgi:type II secretory pathway component PulF
LTPSRSIALSDGQRAELFQGLARAIAAGLDAARALAALRGICNGTLDAALATAAGAVAGGRALIPALDRQGLIAAHDRALLLTGEHAGALAPVCDRLAARYARTHARWRRLKGRLMLPGAVLLLAILLLPLPAVAAGRLGPGGYLLRAGAMLALIAALAALASRTVRRWRAHGTPGWLTHLARALPLSARLSRLHQHADACERLALALACGVPAQDALDALHAAERNGVRRAALGNAAAAARGGAGLAQALREAALLDAPGYAIVSTGEAAGRLDASLQRVADGCNDALDSGYDMLAQWLPVLAYLCVAAVVAAGMIG